MQFKIRLTRAPEANKRDQQEQNYEGRVKIGGVRCSNLRFADDTTLVCSSKLDLQELLKQIKEISKNRGLLLNSKKTVVDSNRAGIEKFMLGEEKIEEVDNLVYLGLVIDTSCKSSGLSLLCRIC